MIRTLVLAARYLCAVLILVLMGLGCYKAHLLIHSWDGSGAMPPGLDLTIAGLGMFVGLGACAVVLLVVIVPGKE